MGKANRDAEAVQLPSLLRMNSALLIPGHDPASPK